LRISSISVPRRRPTAAAAALPAAFTAFPARPLRDAPELLVKPLSANAAKAAVAATATNSATSGLCNSLMNASPMPASSEPRPPSPLRRWETVTDLDLLFVAEGLLAPLVPVAFFALSLLLWTMV